MTTHGVVRRVVDTFQAVETRLHRGKTTFARTGLPLRQLPGPALRIASFWAPAWIHAVETIYLSLCLRQGPFV